MELLNNVFKIQKLNYAFGIFLEISKWNFFKYIKRIKTLCYIDPKYIRKVFDMIFADTENSREVDILLAKIYFKINYIDKFNSNDCNYYKCYDHLTNNSCESYNHVLNSKFSKKSTFWKFLNVLK